MKKKNKTQKNNKNSGGRFIQRIVIAIGKPFYYTTAFLFLYILAFAGIGFPSIVQSFVLRLRRKKRIKPIYPPVFPVWNLVKETLPSFLGGLFTVCLILGAGTVLYLSVLKDLPTPRDLLSRQPPLTTKIYDRNGVLLYKIYKEENRTLVPLSVVPIDLIHAVLSIEDKDFYKHNGFSIRGISRAIFAYIQDKKIQGGSTITQQLVKNTLLSSEKTIRRKLREIVLAFMVETTMEKDEIFEMYFNEVSFGGTIHGVEEASRRYFGKSVRDLTLAESAYLAGLPQAPSAYSPFGPSPELGFARQHQVLDRMVENTYITQEEVAKAKEERLLFQPDITDIKAPHFVMYVRDLLAQEYGESVVSQGGLEVITSLDYELEQLAEKAINTELSKLEQLHVTNGAVLVTNPKTGEILAMVGSRNYFDVGHDGQVNVTLRPRQPGSSIKPLTYATAFEKGYTPSTIIEDAPITYNVLGSPPYSPKNYDGIYHGRVAVRTALASSYNIPAVKTLAVIGVQNVIEKGREMGITTWGEEQSYRFGLSLTLGGGEVLMIDMAKLYGTFANLGMTTNLSPILQVKNHEGKILFSDPCIEEHRKNTSAQTVCHGKRVLDPKIAWQITSILSDTAARAPAFGLHSILTIPKQEVAVKTGTTNSLRDNWTIGYTNDRLVATWVGNNDNTPMSYVASGITGASPIWNTVMTSLLDEKEPHRFASPSGLLKLRICSTTNTLSCETCPYQKEEYFLPGTEPTKTCVPEMFVKEVHKEKGT